MSGIDFIIKIKQQMMAGNAVSELQRQQAAITAAMGKYSELEQAAKKAEQAVGRGASAQARAAAAQQKAAASGDVGGYRKASEQVQALAAKQAALVSASEQAKAAMTAQAGVVEQLAAAYGKEANAAKAAADAEKAKSEAEKTASQAKKDQAKAASEKKDADNRPAEVATEIGQAGRALGRVGGPLAAVATKIGGLSRGWASLSKIMGAGGASAAIAAMVFIALAAAVLKAAYALGEFAVKSALAARNLNITLSAMAGSAAGGKAFGEALDKVNRDTGVASDRLLELTRNLQEAKIPADQIPVALRAIAQQESALGDTSGTEKLIKQIEGGQKSVAKLGDEMEKQFGEAARKRAMDLGTSFERLKKNVAGLFDDLKLDGVLDGVKRIAEDFNKDTVAGRGLKMLLDALLHPLLSDSKELGPAMERAFIMGEIELFKLVNGCLRFAIEVRTAFTTGGKYAGALKVALALVKAELWLLETEFMVWKFVAGLVIDAITSGIDMFVGNLSRGVDAFEDFGATLDDCFDALTNPMRWLAIGQAIIDGIVNGITAGVGRVKSAISNVGTSAIDSIRGILDSHSPSRVFHRIGLDITDGATEGIEEGSDKVSAATAKMVAMPSTKGAKKRAGGGGVYNFVFNGVRDAEDSIDRLEEKMADILEAAGLEAGEPELDPA